MMNSFQTLLSNSTIAATTWSVECMQFVQVPSVGRVLVSGGWDGQVIAW
jgi:hypothetical protein